MKMIIARALIVVAFAALDAVAFIPVLRSGAASSYHARHRRSSLGASSWFGPIRTPNPPAAKPPKEEGNSAVDGLSIPYDAAARLAYEEWRVRNSKGDFNEERFLNFKANYEAVSVANVIAKRKSREAGGTTAPALLSLNEYADCSAEEFQAKRNSSSGGAGDVLGKAFEAAQSQSEASSALAEAAEALAEEEELLAKQLGLDSVDELEIALDSMEGIAADGGELEKENISREARVRSAYLEWCKEYGKEPVESRFVTFASNFLAMESYARESGREMSLNRYADCSEEEYLELTGQRQKEEVRKETKTTESSPKKIDVNLSERRSRDEAAAVEKAEAERRERGEEIAKKKAAQEAWQSMSDEERKAATEKEREERRASQIKSLENLRRENEAAAIAAAKAEQEKEATQIAMRRETDRKAAEILRQKVRELEEKQKLSEKPKRKGIPSSKRKAFDPLSLFSSSGTRAKPTEKDSGDSPLFDVSSLLGGFVPTPTPQAKKVDVPKPVTSFLSTPAKKEGKPSKKKSVEGLSFFTQLKIPAASTVPKPARSSPSTKPAPLQKSASTPPIVAAKPGPFSIFAFPSPKSSPKATPPTEPKKAASSAFSFFGGFSTPKPTAPTLTSAKPAARPSRSAAIPSKKSFSLLGAKPATKKTSAPSPVSPKKEPFLLFGTSKPAAAPKTTRSPPKVVAPKKEPFSFFGTPKPAVGTNSAPKAAAPSPAAAPKKNTFSLFGASKPAAEKATVSKKPEPKKSQKQATSSKDSVVARQVRGTISLTQLAKEEAKQSPFSFFGPKTEPKDDIPVLSRWIQNDDGSITGFVTNSKNFRDNTRITTSPVRIGAKEGQVVKTGSGSRYRLN